MESLVAADNPEGAESVGPVAMSEQAVEQDQSADGPGPSGISAPGSSEQPRPEEGEPLKKKRKLNKLERVKSMQKMIDSFLASEEKGRREFIVLEKKKMEMENEAARNAAIREERFLQVMQQTILMARQPTSSSTASRTAPNKQWQVPL